MRLHDRGRTRTARRQRRGHGRYSGSRRRAATRGGGDGGRLRRCCGGRLRRCALVVLHSGRPQRMELPHARQLHFCGEASVPVHPKPRVYCVSHERTHGHLGGAAVEIVPQKLSLNIASTSLPTRCSPACSRTCAVRVIAPPVSRPVHARHFASRLLASASAVRKLLPGH